MKLRSILPFVFLGAISCRNDDPELLKKVLFNYYDGIKEHDRQKMITSTTEDFLLYEQGKIWNNDSVFAEMARHAYAVKFSFDDFRATVDNKTGHMAYRVRADFVFDDTVDVHLNFIESAAFTKRDDVWKMNFLHVTAQSPRYDTIRYAREYYAQRVKEFSSEPVQKASIIFLGNSIVEYGNWRKLLKDSAIVNRGVAADNTFGVLERLEDVIVREPEKLFIEIGINDISQNIPVNIIISNITAIVNRVRSGSPHTKIHVISILPTNDNARNEYPDAFNKNDISNRVNEGLRSRASDGSFIYIDLNCVLRDKQGKLSTKYANDDGLHLNDEGYKQLIALLRSKNYI
jgi:lysophospholipase L1-like esterase